MIAALTQGHLRKSGWLLAMALVAALAWNVSPTVADSHCIDTGFEGLTAVSVNEDVVGTTINVDGCDVGAFFDQNGVVSGATFNGTVAGAKSTQYGVLVVGADVAVQASEFHVEDGYSHQFISIAYRDGATGRIARNVLQGAHRVGVLVRGEGTDVQVKGNSITGTGAKTSGWAENGIQVDQGANATVANNTVEGHWWDGESNFASTGIFVSGANGLSVTNNRLVDNEFSFYIVGDNNKVSGNRTSSEIISGSSLAFQAYGMLIGGSNNHAAGNSLSATDGAVGIYIFPGAANTKVTGNRISGFEDPIFDGGDDTMNRGNPSQFN
ncbi:MAG: right-handed parallel beta-helix repeat-containing protein [Dehalococcoidia bacterium]